MSIKIHHGPPGSYKTSGAVMDDFIPAARAGRVVVTNVRGLCSVERVTEALGEVGDGFDLIHLPTIEHEDAAKNREYLAKWWHWLPHGALLLLDEAQSIWPQSWKDAELKALDFPGGLEAATAENRPLNFLTAFEMHRHYGWDLVLTTPNITKIRKDILACAEGAFKHKNLKLVGIGGRYLEGFHMADDTGKSASDFLSVRSRKITKETWGLYDSTATGTISDTKAGLSLFADPKVLGLLGLLTLLVLGLGAFGRLQSFSGATGTPDAAVDSPGAPFPAVPGPAPVVDSVPKRVVPVEAPSADPLKGYSIRIAGRFADGRGPVYIFEVTDAEMVMHYRQSDVLAMGYEIVNHGDCLIELRLGALRRFASCARQRSARPAPVSMAAAANGAP